MVRFSGFKSTPSVVIWKNAMITTSASSIPYSRKLCRRCSPIDWWAGASVMLAMPYPFTIMRMMRSWLASAAGSWPTSAPSFIT